jgi:catechol 2,3-dioxygenase-like lactoylglutathione lyase family enzyme
MAEAVHGDTPQGEQSSPTTGLRPCCWGSNFDFEADLDDLGGRHAEIGSRKISVEVHRGEKPFSPHGHPRHLAARDHHHSSKIIRDLLGIDATQASIAAGEFQSVHHIGVFHKSELQDNSDNPCADRDKPPFAVFDGAELPSAGERQHVNHLALPVDTPEEFDAAYQRLKDHGVAVTEIIERGYGKTFYFPDPNGIRLQIELKTKQDVDSLEGDPDPVPYVHTLLQRA